MAQTTISVRMDEELKKQFEDFCSATGINVSTAINSLVEGVVRKKTQIDLKSDPFFSEENMQRLRDSITALNEGRKVTKTLEELKEMEDE